MRLPVTLALAIPLNFLFAHIYITQRHMPIALTSRVVQRVQDPTKSPESDQPKSQWVDPKPLAG